MSILQFLTDQDILDKKVTARPNHHQPVSGYGKDIPTRIMVLLRYSPNRWRRVYCCCYSNSPSTYVKLPGHTWGVLPPGV